MKRDYAFQVRMTRDEGLAMEQKARLAGLSKSEYARRRLVNQRRTAIEREAVAAHNGKGGMLKRGVKARVRAGQANAKEPPAAPHCPTCLGMCAPGCLHWCHET